MDQRRQLLSAAVAVFCFLIWMQVAPLLFPQFFAQPKQAVKKAVPKPGAAAQLAQDRPQGEKPETPPALPAAVIEKLPDFPPQTITLGQPGFAGGYLIQAELTARGAAIDALWLTDPRYTTLDRKEQLKIVGNPVRRNVGGEVIPKTFDTSLPQIDQLLEPHQLSLATVNWEVVHQDAASVTFRYPSPAGDLEILKTYRLPKVDVASRDSSVEGYLLDLEIEIRNLTDKLIKTEYTLQGPIGLPLENADNTRVFREIKLGALEKPHNPDAVTAITLRAADLVKQVDKAKNGGNPVDNWRVPVHYAGLDDQFFAALVLPQGDQLDDRDHDGHPDAVISITRPELLEKAPQADRSNLTIVMESPQLTVPAEGKITNEFKTFFGPKRPELMYQLKAESIIQLGWFAVVAKAMLLVLGFFHNVIGLPYALSIILLTVCVRGAMFPISRKQAIEAEKMKVLAPKMKEMQEKHKNQPEEFAKAYREFQKKHNYHPMIGCLPALIQLPIFLGLYNSLYHAIDLRLAKFLWIDNLAAPDALAHLPFTVPYFGWTEFNLLPIITVVLFVVQQKMFTPPPTSEEQAMQYKMMNVMMIAIGFAFYRVPAGLCLYFIASSLWGVTERLLLKKNLAAHSQALQEAGRDDADQKPDVAGSPAAHVPAPPAERKLRAPGWWERMLEAADQAKNATEGQASQRKFSKGKDDKRTKPRR